MDLCYHFNRGDVFSLWGPCANVHGLRRGLTILINSKLRLAKGAQDLSKNCQFGDGFLCHCCCCCCCLRAAIDEELWEEAFEEEPLEEPLEEPPGEEVTGPSLCTGGGKGAWKGHSPGWGAVEK